MQDWFKQPPRPPTPNPEWNKLQVVLDQPEQHWFNQMVSAAKDPLTFNDLMATLIDFSKYVLNRLLIDHLTQEILVRPSYNLLKGTCTSSIELEYNMEECFKALTYRLDQNNPEGDRCPFDLTKPLPLKGHPGHLTVAAEYLFNNDLEFLKSSDLEKNTLRLPRRQKQLEGDFVDLHLNYIKDMLLLAVQHKLFHLDGSDIFDFIVALRMFTRSLIIKRRVKDLQLGVESYQKKLNITKPQKTFLEIEFKELYTPSHKPQGVIYEDLNKQKWVMRADELYKFSDGTLKTICDALHHRILDFCLGYNKEMSRRKCTSTNKKRLELMVELIDKQMRERRIIRNLE
ncbi:hypothetical protein Tco_0066020 [Tanacetum coccineum]